MLIRDTGMKSIGGIPGVEQRASTWEAHAKRLSHVLAHTHFEADEALASGLHALQAFAETIADVKVDD